MLFANWTNIEHINRQLQARNNLPKTVIELEMVIAISQTMAILMVVSRLVVWRRERRGFRMPK